MPQNAIETQIITQAGSHAGSSLFCPMQSLQNLGCAIQWITLLVSVTLNHWICMIIYMIFIYLQRQCFDSWIAALSKF